MKMTTRKIIYRLTWLLIIVSVVWASGNINWESHRYTRIIKVDGNGYYAYLPAVFIYHDLNFSFYDQIREKYGQGHFDDEYRYTYQGMRVNKYYAGTALALSPLFLSAHVITMASGGMADGYSYWYLIFLNLGAILYLLLGLWLFDRTLRTYSIGFIHRSLTLLAMLFGTNLYYYTVYEPSMSHVYSFAFLNLFIFSVRRFALHRQFRNIILASAGLGFIVLIRPVNVIVLLSIPFLAGGWKPAIHLLKSTLGAGWKLMIPAFLMVMIISIQPILYRIQTGTFFVYSYGNEGFNFLDPHMAEFLFSFKKGFFIYTPVALISLLGLIFLFRESRPAGRMWLLFITIVVCTLSSWEQWWYGGSFSARVMVEYLPFFGILLALLLKGLQGRRIYPYLLFLLFILVLYCQFQTYQYYFGILHWEDMDAERYREIFLRLR